MKVVKYSCFLNIHNFKGIFIITFKCKIRYKLFSFLRLCWYLAHKPNVWRVSPWTVIYLKNGQLNIPFFFHFQINYWSRQLMSNILHFTAITFKCDSTMFIYFRDHFYFFSYEMLYNYIFINIISSSSELFVIYKNLKQYNYIHSY